MALPQEGPFHRVPSECGYSLGWVGKMGLLDPHKCFPLFPGSCLVAVVAKSSVLPMESPSGAGWVFWWPSTPLSHTL